MKLLQVKPVVMVVILSFFHQFIFANPFPPSIKYVSVNPKTNDISVAWYSSPATNVDSLVIEMITQISPFFKSNNLNSIKVNSDGIYTLNVSDIYTLTTSKVNSSLMFSIDAYAGGISSTNLNNYQKTIFATSKFTTCPNKNRITWTKYSGNGITVNKYNIYLSDTSGDIKLNSVAATDTIYDHVIQNGGTYNYFVEAEFVDIKGNTQTSTSNMTTVTAVLPTNPTFLLGRYTQVRSNDSILLRFDVDIYSDIKHFQIYKSNSKSGPYIPMNNGDITVAKAVLIFYDKDSNIALKRNFYKIYAINNCGDTVKSSNIISNMVVSVNNTPNTNEISWDAFVEWSQGIDSYKLYRAIDGENPAPLLYYEANVTLDKYSYIDYLDNIAGSGNEQCYFVETAPLKERDLTVKSISNKVCIKQKDRIFIPDAFNPVSKITANQVFKPQIAYIKDNSYSFTVYNRLNETVFSTTDPQKAWDGKFKNEFVAEGTYLYNIRYRNTDGIMMEKTGTFFVIFKE